MHTVVPPRFTRASREVNVSIDPSATGGRRVLRSEPIRLYSDRLGGRPGAEMVTKVVNGFVSINVKSLAGAVNVQARLVAEVGGVDCIVDQSAVVPLVAIRAGASLPALVTNNCCGNSAQIELLFTGAGTAVVDVETQLGACEPIVPAHTTGAA